MNTHWDCCVSCRQMKPRGRLGLRMADLSSASNGSSHCLFLNAAVTSELHPSRFFLETTQCVWSIAFSFFPFQALFLLWCFQMFRLQFYSLFLICLLCTWDWYWTILCPEAPKDSSAETILILITSVLLNRSVVWGYFAVSQGKAMCFSLLADVSRLLFITMKSITVWLPGPKSLLGNNWP